MFRSGNVGLFLTLVGISHEIKARRVAGGAAFGPEFSSGRSVVPFRRGGGLVHSFFNSLDSLSTWHQLSASLRTSNLLFPGDIGHTSPFRQLRLSHSGCERLQLLLDNSRANWLPRSVNLNVYAALSSPMQESEGMQTTPADPQKVSQPECPPRKTRASLSPP
jgi:hypothetical protein